MKCYRRTATIPFFIAPKLSESSVSPQALQIPQIPENRPPARPKHLCQVGNRITLRRLQCSEDLNYSANSAGFHNAHYRQVLLLSRAKLRFYTSLQLGQGNFHIPLGVLAFIV